MNFGWRRGWCKFLVRKGFLQIVHEFAITGNFFDNVTATDEFSAAPANYVHYSNVSENSITVDLYNGGSPGVLLHGIQLVGQSAGVPPPSDFTWSGKLSRDWKSRFNWSPNLETPTGNDKSVSFGDAIEAPGTVFTDEAVTVKNVSFDNSNGYAIAGKGSVNMEADSGNASINILQGSHEFQAVVNLNSDTDVVVASSSVLAFNNALNLNGRTLNQSGDGTVNINNRLNSGGGTVNVSGGTLGGSGAVGGSVSNSGGTVAPGNSPGILTIDGGYSQGAGGTLSLEIGGLVPGEEHDKLVVTGAVDLAGTVAVELTGGFSPAANDTFDVLDFSSFVDSNFAFDFSQSGGAGSWDTSLFGTDGSLCFGSCLGGGGGGNTDYDNDGTWNLGDLNLVLFNWQQNETALPIEWVNQRPAKVGLDALNVVLFNWQQSASLATVPEPATAFSVLVGLLAVVGWNRWRS